MKAIVSVHVSAFPDFFLTKLGTLFLKLLYTGYIESPVGVCLVFEGHQGIVGVAAGTTKPKKFFKHLTQGRKLALFALAAAPGLLRHPFLVIRKSLWALVYRGESPVGLPGAALLSSLAVDSHHAGRGVGKALVQAFADEARKNGCSAVYLTTDAVGNERVNCFYRKCGFTLRDTIQRPGSRVMNRWVMEL